MMLNRLSLPCRYLKAIQPFVKTQINAKTLENLSQVRQIHGSLRFRGTRPQILSGQLKRNTITNPCMVIASKSSTSGVKTDNISDGSTLVYSNNFKKSLFITHIGVTAVMPFVCGFGAAAILRHYNNLSVVLVDNTSDVLGPIGSAMFGLFLYSTVSVLVNRTMLRLYYNEETEKFTGVYYNMFFQKKKIVFDHADTATKPVDGFLNELAGNITIKGRPFFIVITDFSSPSYYNKLMGYTKDFSGE